jgi:hypothetical protein
MKKVKDLPKDTNVIGLQIRIPLYLRSPINLLNKGYIISFWDDSDSYNGAVILPNRSVGIWLANTNSKDKKRVIYPCFLNNLTEIYEFQLIEDKGKEIKSQLDTQSIKNTTNIES